jgi:hypothetical protein
VSDQNFRGDLNRAFDNISGEPSPALSDRVRSSIAQAPEARGPYWIAAVAACIMAALIVGVLVVANPLNRRPAPIGPGPVTTATPSATPSPSATPTPVATPSASPSATPSTLPAFVCTTGDITTTGSQPVAFVSDMRTGTHPGYDRVTITFSNGLPAGGVHLAPQTGTTFTASPSGQQLVLKGSNGILVVIHGSDLHTSYNGSLDFVTGYASMAEVRRVEDFEGVVQLGIGINGAACYRAFLLDSPTRLVIDIQSGG